MCRTRGWTVALIGVLGVIGLSSCAPDDGVSPARGEAEEVLRRQVKSSDLNLRLPAVFKLASRLKPGMTKKQVEDLLGPPDSDIRDSSTFNGIGSTAYFCRPPGVPDNDSRLIAIHYDLKGPPPRFIEVSKPFSWDD